MTLSLSGWHRWSQITTADYVEIIDAVAKPSGGESQPYDQGVGNINQDQAQLLVEKIGKLLQIKKEEPAAKKEPNLNRRKY